MLIVPFALKNLYELYNSLSILKYKNLRYTVKLKISGGAYAGFVDGFDRCDDGYMYRNIGKVYNLQAAGDGTWPPAGLYE